MIRRRGTSQRLADKYIDRNGDLPTAQEEDGPADRYHDIEIAVEQRTRELSEVIDVLIDDIDTLRCEVNDLWAALDAVPDGPAWWQWITRYRLRRDMRRILSYSSNRIYAEQADPDTT